jgi:hypothetical protein
MNESHIYKIDGTSLTEPHERRKHARYPFTSMVDCVELKSRTRLGGRTSDLSLGGCYVDTTSTFPAGSVIKLRLTKEMDYVEVTAVVVYSLVDMGMGVKFTGVGAEQLRTLEKWVRELSGEQVSQPEMIRVCDQTCTSECPEGAEFLVLRELIMELMKQGVLSSAKSSTMLERLTSAGRAVPQTIPTYAIVN